MPKARRTDEVLTDALHVLSDSGLLRNLRTIESAQGPVVRVGGQNLLLFCSNNYLGLANHPEVIEAAREATLHYGASAGASQLVSGHMQPHAELEEQIANWKGCEAALIFSSGFLANLGAITALTCDSDLVLSDSLNHASIIDGCRLSRAQKRVYRHGDTNHLEFLLKKNANKARRTLIVTESVFSMDGDCAPLSEITLLAEQYGAWLMVDEAHSTGVFGKNGAGLVDELGLTDAVDIHLGTLGKALGSFGAYIAGSRSIIETLVNGARSFIYTTGLPPSAAAAARAAINICTREPVRASRLRRRARSLGQYLREAGLEIPHLDSHILPVYVGSTQQTVQTSCDLLERGIYVAAIREPTVPRGTSRLRLSLMANHTIAQIERLKQELPNVVRNVSDPS